MVIIFGCNSDKDIKGMLYQLQYGADKVIFTRAVNTPRAARPEDLAADYEEQSGKTAQVTQTLNEGLTIAKSAVSREDLICITGSFYLVGEAKHLIQGK